MLNEHNTPNTPQSSEPKPVDPASPNEEPRSEAAENQSSEPKPVDPASPNEGPRSEAAENNGSKILSNASAENNEAAASVESNATASLSTSETVALPAETSSTKPPRKIRTPQQKALDEAVEAHKKATEKGLAAIAAARANLQESDRERKFAAGTKMMHKLLLKCDASTRGAVISMLSGIADHMGQEALQAYLEAINSTPVKN